MPDNAAEIVRAPRTRWRKFTLIALAIMGVLVIAVVAAYYALTVPVMSPDELEEHFAAAREYFTSVAPERIALGERYLALIDQRPVEEGDPEMHLDLDVLYEGEHRERCQQMLKDGRDFLKGMRALGAEGVGAFAYDVEAGPAAEFSWLMPARDAAWVLLFDLREAFLTGDLERGMADFRAVLRLSQTAEHRGALIARLVAVQIRTVMYREILSLREKLSDTCVAELVVLLGEAEAQMPPLADLVWSEINCAEYIYKVGLQMVTAGGLERVRTKIADLLVSWELDAMKAMKASPPAALVALEDLERELLPGGKGVIDRFWNQFPRSFIPSVQSCYTRLLMELAFNRGTRIVLALEAYKRAHDTYPDELSALVPDILSELPVDTCSGASFKYSKTEELFLLYGIGSDRVDQGGRLPEDADADDPPSDGEVLLQFGPDWVIAQG